MAQSCGWGYSAVNTIGTNTMMTTSFFYVIEGQLLIDLEDRLVSLDPRQGFVVPKGVMHRTRAPQRTVVLMVENAGIIPTGN